MSESQEDILAGDIFDKLTDDCTTPKNGFMEWLLKRLSKYRASTGQVLNTTPEKPITAIGDL